MALAGSNLELVPIILKVKTSEEFTVLAHKNNVLNHMKYNYALPAPFINGHYELQFFADVKRWKNPQTAKPNETGEVV